MKFGEAIEHAYLGRKIRREGWNNSDAFVILVPGQHGVQLTEGSPYHAVLGGVTASINPHLDMIYPANDTRPEALAIPGWLASQSDMLANDWVVLA